MALQPYVVAVPAQQQVAIQPQQMRQVAMDPFAQMDGMMDQMMLSPFGGPPGMGGPMGMGGIFGQMDRMMQQMMGGPMGPGGGDMMMGGPMGMGMGGGQMMSMQMGGFGGGEGGFSSQTMMISSSMGPDGQTHTERFASSSVSDPTRRVAESQQAYSNSATMVDKMALERQMGDRARKMVKEYNRQSGDERNTELYRGMTEADCPEFDTQWRTNAAPYLQHPDLRGMQLMAPQAAPAAIAQAPGGVRLQQAVSSAQPAYAAYEPAYAAYEPAVYASGVSPNVASAASSLPTRQARVIGEAVAPSRVAATQSVPVTRPASVFGEAIPQGTQPATRYVIG